MKENNTAEALLHTLLYSMKEFSFLSERYLEKNLQNEAAEISLSQIVVLASIDIKNAEGTAPHQCNIAEFLHVTEATISKHIKSLITLGYLRKSERKNKKRGNNIELTPEGSKKLQVYLTVVNAHIYKLLSPLSLSEKNDLRNILQKLLKPLL